MNSSYRVLKLRSGEEIIAQVKGRDENKIVLQNPMIFKSTTQVNNLGQTHEITFLKDWLATSSIKTTKIPENAILTWLVPSNDILRLYDIERKTKTRSTFQRDASSTPKFPSKPNTPFSSFNREALDQMLWELENQFKNEKNPNHKNDNDKFFFMHMMIPPDMMDELLREGLLDIDADDDEEDDEYFSESINPDAEYTGDENDREDYGNRWTDWNPDPDGDDYN
jgi:hypothetical protein